MLLLDRRRPNGNWGMSGDVAPPVARPFGVADVVTFVTKREPSIKVRSVVWPSISSLVVPSVAPNLTDIGVSASSFKNQTSPMVSTISIGENKASIVLAPRSTAGIASDVGMFWRGLG